MSPSMRREWIEIFAANFGYSKSECLPPCGGSGLKFSGRKTFDGSKASPSMRREWIEMSGYVMPRLPVAGLPPCGGSGLKYKISLRFSQNVNVSLHAEGVD